MVKRTLQNVYRRLLTIPTVGPICRIPILSWRALRGTASGHGFRPGVSADTLALAIASLDSLRAGHANHSEKLDFTVAALESLRTGYSNQSKEITIYGDEIAELRTWHSKHAKELTTNKSEIMELREKISFMRSEIMLELHAQLNGAGPTSQGAGCTARKVAAEKQVINKSKVEEQIQAGGLRLNIGCGDIFLDTHINIDIRILPGLDAVGDATDLPFDAESVTEITSSHLLEHFSLANLRLVVLPHWKQILRPGGKLHIAVSDVNAMINDYSRGEMSFKDFHEAIYGLQEYECDFNRNMFTPQSLTQLLQDLEFTEITVHYEGKKKGHSREMELSCIRP